MPVTFHPATHKASQISFDSCAAKTPTDLLSRCSPEEHMKCESVIQSSFSDSDLSHRTVKASDNGFIRAAIDAYNEHLNLTIRPDDVWLAILTQFNIYVNAQPEDLRHHFVAHKGKKEVMVVGIGSTMTYDWAKFPLEIGKLLEVNVTDPELRSWIIPDFSTTTATDEVVCSIVMMSTLQHYFSYKMYLLCGIPSVTLQGEKADWQKILARINKLPTFGKEVEEWYKLLVPIISRFVAAFDDPESEENKDFWQKIAKKSGGGSGGSGPFYLEGWLTAFCFWGEKGLNLHQQAMEYNRRGLSLDGVQYHCIDMDVISPGWTAVPVEVDDNGNEFTARMMAGSVGIQALSSGEPGADGNVGKDTLQPEVGWWMMKVKSEKVEE